MKRIACVVALLFAMPALAVSPDDCSLQFLGSSRKHVKLRPPSLAAQYATMGTPEQPSNVDALFQFGCDPELHLPGKIPETEAIDLEKRVVTLRAFVMAVRFEKFLGFSDQDFHIELSDSRDWNASNHLVVEIPPGPVYCDARKAMWQLVKDDAAAAGMTPGKTHFFSNPPLIEVVGFLFFDAQHQKQGAPCNSPGKHRGIKNNDHPRKAQGLWELHPVFAVRQVE
jgi:hypothetical protein